MDPHDALVEELRKWEAEKGADGSDAALPSMAEEAPVPAGGGGGPRAAMAQAAMGAAPAPAKSPLSMPLGAPPPTPKAAAPKDTELEDAQRQATRNKQIARLGQAVTGFTERPTNFLDYAQRLGHGGTSGPPAHNKMWDQAEAEADQPVADLQARRKSEADMASKQSSAANTAERKDPNSQTAQTYRSVLLKFAPDLADKLANATPEQMEKIAPWLEKYASENGQMLEAKILADAKAKTTPDKAKELDALKAVLKGAYPEKAAEIDSIGSAKAAEDFRLINEGRLGRDTTIKAAQQAAGVTRTEAGKVRDEKAMEDIPPGYSVSDGSHPGAETRKKFTGLVSAAEKMKGLTAQMREALKGTNGISRTLDPATVTKLKQLGTMIAIEGKNVAGLGALSGPDMGLMEAIASDPTSIKANLTVDLPRMLDQLDAWGDNSVKGESAASGIVKAGGSSQAGHGAKPSPGPGFVRGTVNGKPGWVNKEAGEWEPD